MWPTLVEISTPWGPIGLHTYGLMMLLAFSAAYLLVHARARVVGIHPDKLLPVYVAAFVGGIVGSRLLYAFAVEPGRTLADPLSLFALGGFAFYGGVIGGAVAVLSTAALTGVPGWKFLDIAAPATLLGLGIGRLGCFFAGCCHGAQAPIGADPTALLPEDALEGQLWLSDRFPFLTTEFHPGGVTRAELMNLPLYPTQLWSVALGLGLAGLLVWMWRHRRFDGQIVAMMLMLQPLDRIFVESFRADHRGYWVSWQADPAWVAWLPGLSGAGEALSRGAETVAVGITTSQGIGLLMMAVGASLWALRRKAGVSPEVEIEEEG